MKKTARTQHLQKLLNLCDDLHRIGQRMGDPEVRGEARTKLRRQSRRKVMQLARDLSSSRFRGPLTKVMRDFRFGPEHFLLLAELLHRHLRSEDRSVEGRVLLGGVYQTSFEVLAGLQLLREDSPLRASGLVVVDDDEDCPDDLLEARFRISEEALEAFRDEVAGLVPEDLRSSQATSYANNRQFLVDLRILHNLYKERSDRVFHPDRWDRLHHASLAPGRGLSRRIDAMWRRVRRKLDGSTDRASFPAVQFMVEYMLTETEMMVVVHLLFKELYEGNAYADAAELLRLISTDEGELIDNRRIFASNGNLRADEIIHVEPMLENRELTGEVHLNDWVVQALFGAATVTPGRMIHPDEKLDWHLYLQNLGESEKFFRDLEAN